METIISVYKDGIIGTAAIMAILTMTAYYVQEYGVLINRIIASAIGG